MVIVQVTTHEGDRWENWHWEDVQALINQDAEYNHMFGYFAAVRFGDTIYDFVLARLGHNPWRRRQW